MVDCEALNALRKERDELRDDRDRWRICSSEWVAKATKLEAERNSSARALKECNKKFLADRDVAQTNTAAIIDRTFDQARVLVSMATADLDAAQTQIRKLEIERDGWEAKAKELEAALKPLSYLAAMDSEAALKPADDALPPELQSLLDNLGKGGTA